MRPWQHAKSSARAFGGSWQADLPIHEFLDVTKFAVADLRHRIVLHNSDLGPRLIGAAFPNHPCARQIALHHVREDLGCEPSLADWLSCCDLNRLPVPRRRDILRGELVASLAQQFQLESEDGPKAVVDILLTPMELAPAAGPSALSVLCNSVGPLIVRKVLGPPCETPSRSCGTTVFDPALVAEATILWLMGRRIYSLSEIVMAVRSFPA